MTYNPNIHHRRSIRLKGYDYSQAGLYFITICCHQRIHLFGHVGANNHSPDHSFHNHSPDHSSRPVHLSDDANNHPPTMHLNDAGKIAAQCWLAIPDHFPNVRLHDYIIMPQPPQPPLLRSPSKTIGSMVRGFKIGVTKWMRQNTDIYNVWQRNYYEHIIRDEQSYQRISNYIIANPQNWIRDKFYS